METLTDSHRLMGKGPDGLCVQTQPHDSEVGMRGDPGWV